jgi:hypothetical protein
MKKLLVRLGLVSAVVAATVLIPAAPAQAVWSCRSWAEWPVYAYSLCDYGWGYHRVKFTCWYQYDGHIDTFWGPWKLKGQTSVGICQGSYVNQTWYELG